MKEQIEEQKLRLLVFKSALELGKKVDEHLLEMYNLDKDKYISLMLEKAGLRLFNSSLAIELCDDKMLTHIILAKNGIKNRV